MYLIDFYKSACKLYLLDKKAIKNIKEKSLLEVILGVMLISILGYLLIGLIIDVSLFKSIHYKSFLLSKTIFSLINLFLVGSIIFILLKLFGGKGSFKTTLIYSISFQLIANIVPIFLLMINSNFIKIITIIILYLWTFYIGIQIFSKEHSISKLRVFFVFFIIGLCLLIITTYLILFIMAFGGYESFSDFLFNEDLNFLFYGI